MSGAAPTGPRPSGTYLDRIVPAVAEHLQERRKVLPLSILESATRGRSSERGAAFQAALAAPGMSLIAEVKRASPSKGLIRPSLDVAAVVSAYERGGARALSVLTEADYFRGSLVDLEEAVAATLLPVLRKDFIIDEYQVYEARVSGAAAVLLIAALLPDQRLAELAQAAEELGLAVLLEVHDGWELDRALAVDSAIIGINNRDLRTFEVSLDTTLRLAPQAPAGRLLVGESGITSREDVERLAACGVDGVLVGEGLLRAEDLEGAARALLGTSGAAFGASESADGVAAGTMEGAG